jgi:transcriptional regulator with XRE-family HTH domain
MAPRRAVEHSGSMLIAGQIRRRLAATVRAARKAKRMTQEELASQVDCSVETISNMERGASLPGLALFFQVAAVLELDIATLVPTAHPRRSKSKARLAMEAEAFHLAQSLSDDRLRLWLETGKVFAVY